jgi:hypothetical protein
MALIDCKECGKKISDKAMSCPKCGVTPPATCTACGKEFGGEAKACPQCGCPKKDPKNAVTPFMVFLFLFLWFAMYFLWELIL